jgi:hypothetical protein
MSDITDGYKATDRFRQLMGERNRDAAQKLDAETTRKGKSLSERVAGLEERHAAICELCGEMILTLEVNRQRGTIVCTPDTATAALDTLVTQWRGRLDRLATPSPSPAGRSEHA